MTLPHRIALGASAALVIAVMAVAVLALFQLDTAATAGGTTAPYPTLNFLLEWVYAPIFRLLDSTPPSPARVVMIVRYSLWAVLVLGVLALLALARPLLRERPDVESS